MKLKHEKLDGVIIISVIGRLDTLSSPELESDVRIFLEMGARKLLIDMAEAEYISSAGLRVLLVLAKESGVADCAFALCCSNDAIREVLAISGFDTIIPLAPDRKAALDKMRAGA